MHLKNFSLLKTPAIGCALSPACDMVSTVLVNPADKEELALTLNAKKKRLAARVSMQLSIPKTGSKTTG
jgi:serine/threonine-protein kinase HipA